MKEHLILSSLIFIIYFHKALSQSEKNETDVKAGKVFSLFSVVQFKNTGCRSQSTMTSGQSSVRNGTCYTASECSNKGGSASGNCAAGFGVCCLFLVSNSGSTINQNCTYIRNPGFPTAYTTTSSISYNIAKCSADVCYLRLDFETFTTLGPVDTSEPSGGLCPDQFKVTTNTGQLVPIICGQNTGQHIYLDIGSQSTDSATLAFTFGTTASTTRAWEVKVTQIPCYSATRPPNGCLQYQTTLTGTITTFNWLATASSNLQNQQYSACIRRAAGYCCIEYLACQSTITSFTLDSRTIAAQDTYCTGDYIIIPGSTNICTGSGQSLATKYCGKYLGGLTANSYSVPVCDCTASPQVYIKTDAIQENTLASRGLCLTYMQIPCTTN